MHNNSLEQTSKTRKKLSNNQRHDKDDSDLDKNYKFKENLSSKNQTVESGRRIKTEQSGKIFSKYQDTFCKKSSHFKSSNQNSKINSPNRALLTLKNSKHSSYNNLKNFKLSTSVNKKIYDYLNVFVPKNNQFNNINLSKDKISKDLSTNLNSKSGLKKITGSKAAFVGKINKPNQQDKIQPFMPYPANQPNEKRFFDKSTTNQKNIKKVQLNKSKQQKPKLKYRGQSKSKVLKTLQNQQSQNLMQRNQSKRERSKKKIIERQKIYHNVKMKTQQSMQSCETTPSQVFYHDIQLMQLIGEGTFGKVYKAMIKKTSQIVAIKRVFQDKKFKNRQIQIISMLSNSSYVTRAIGTFLTYEGQNNKDYKQYLNIVMKYYESDLYRQIKNNQALSNISIKIYLYSILRGLLYLHSKNICHRDIKPHNVLIDYMNAVICDFGSAKVLVQHQKNLPYICSRCYRAPELIFGSTQYTTMIDIWSVGCIILEIIHGSPFFIGNSSIDHLIEVIKVLGTPTKTQVKQMNPEYDLKDYKFPNIKNKPFSKLFPNADSLLINLLQQIMIYAPKERLNAAEALVHQYFQELRQQQFYTKICRQYDLPDFFNFTPQQMKGNEHLYGQLVPSWYSKNHQTYFQDEQIERNNTLKFYFD